MAEHIDAVLYINLAHRTDRNEHILHEIHKIPNLYHEKIHRIDAIKMENGALGCGLSHIKALKYALDNNWKTVLMLEDDFTFKNDSIEKIGLLFDHPFDVGLLSYNGLQYSDTNNEFIKRVIYAQTTSSYIIKKEYIPILLDNMKKAMTDMLKNGKKHSNCLDIHWTSLQVKDNWYTLYPAIGYQYGNYSDIENGFRNYGC